MLGLAPGLKMGKWGCSGPQKWAKAPKFENYDFVAWRGKNEMCVA